MAYALVRLVGGGNIGRAGRTLSQPVLPYCHLSLPTAITTMALYQLWATQGFSHVERDASRKSGLSTICILQGDITGFMLWFDSLGMKGQS